jgi:hypothetical protein
VKHILDFTARAQIPISEENVREHLGFFKSLLDQMREELQGGGASFEELLNVLQFSFAMNFDDNGLWARLYEAMDAELLRPTHKLQELMKFLSVLENLELAQTEEGGDPMLSEEQLYTLRTKSMNTVSLQLRSKESELSTK